MEKTTARSKNKERWKRH